MIKSFAEFFFLPPVNLLSLAIGSFFLSRHRGGFGWWVAAISLLGLFALAIPAISDHLLVALESYPTGSSVVGSPPPAAIVILGGDVRQIDAPGQTTGIGRLTLERLRAGAEVYRATHLPVLTTGGGDRNGPPVAVLMAQSLRQDFDVPTRWVEGASNDTWENAKRSAAILNSERINSVFLVTHAWHMRRSLIAFSRFGIAVTPAPVTPDRLSGFELADLVPRASSWLVSFYALHEWLGCAWYSL